MTHIDYYLNDTHAVVGVEPTVLHKWLRRHPHYEAAMQFLRNLGSFVYMLVGSYYQRLRALTDYGQWGETACF